MGKLSWGKPTILIQDAEEPGAPWLQTPNPVKDSTTLEPEEGETQTAECEGGEVEDEMHAKNKATLSFEIRAAKDRHLIVADNDGVIEHHHRIQSLPMLLQIPQPHPTVFANRLVVHLDRQIGNQVISRPFVCQFSHSLFPLLLR